MTFFLKNLQNSRRLALRVFWTPRGCRNTSTVATATVTGGQILLDQHGRPNDRRLQFITTVSTLSLSSRLGGSSTNFGVFPIYFRILFYSLYILGFYFGEISPIFGILQIIFGIFFTYYFWDFLHMCVLISLYILQYRSLGYIPNQYISLGAV